MFLFNMDFKLISLFLFVMIFLGGKCKPLVKHRLEIIISNLERFLCALLIHYVVYLHLFR